MFTNIPELTPDPVSTDFDHRIRQSLDSKTKPRKSLGDLEDLAFRIARIQQTNRPQISAPGVLIFAADHGITKYQDVSAYPREVTGQMVANILNGGAACSVLARQHRTPLQVVDAGVDADLPEGPGLVLQSFGRGTADMFIEPAISEELLQPLLETGARCIDDFRQLHPLDLFLPGEMGIGNTSSAALITHYISDIPLNELINKGTGLQGEQLERKKQILNKVADLHRGQDLPKCITAVGGFEIIMMAGAMLRAATLGIPVVVDGFICTTAFMIAKLKSPGISDYAIFAHKSGVNGHQMQLNYLNEKPLLDLQMRLGEASGALTALPLIISSTKILSDMAEFDSAGVTDSDNDT